MPAINASLTHCFSKRSRTERIPGCPRVLRQPASSQNRPQRRPATPVQPPRRHPARLPAPRHRLRRSHRLAHTQFGRPFSGHCCWVRDSEPSVPVRTILVTIGLVLLSALAVLFVMRVYHVLVWTLIALFFTVALYPVAGWVQRRL